MNRIRIRAPELPKLPDDFVPKYLKSLSSLQTFYNDAKRLVVLTGAGISTDSGIPDYRSPGRPPHNPILYYQFLESMEVRKRYWARGLIGYQTFSSCKPNDGHRAVHKFQESGKCFSIITQNVDGFHQQVGSKNVLEMHGNLHHIKCLDCHSKYPRAEIQEKLIENNIELWELYNYKKNIAEQQMKPDGDIDLLSEDYSRFNLPSCINCNSMNIHPDIVFMGGSLDTGMTEQTKEIIKNADSLLVVGSTLAVFSAYRLVLQANKAGIPVAVINKGITRADPIADIKIEENITDTLVFLAKS